MGGGFWNQAQYQTKAVGYQKQTAAQIFRKSLDPEMDPKNLIKVRECCDSLDHPEAVPIIIALDVTGSMGRIPENLVKYLFGTLLEKILNLGITSPQILFLFVGDMEYDQAPLQISQFEASTELLDRWLTAGYLEGHGGGNSVESYNLAWLVAARHTYHDHFVKRGKKGYLFTIGDEGCTSAIKLKFLKEHMCNSYSECQEDIPNDVILKEAQERYYTFHIHANNGSYPDNPSILQYWQNLLGFNFSIANNDDEIIEQIVNQIKANL